MDSLHSALIATSPFLWMLFLFNLAITCFKKKKKPSSEESPVKTAYKKSDKRQPTVCSTCSQLSTATQSVSKYLTDQSTKRSSCSICNRSMDSTASEVPQIHNLLEPIKNPRKRLPFDQIPGDRISFFDLMRLSIPIHAFEPLSTIQGICEELRFANRFLNNINDIKKADERMLQIIGFIISAYTGLPGRKRKPFESLLGETFDFIHKDWKYHAEQVSFHPPISACHAESEKFGWEWFQTMDPEILPSLDVITFQPVLPVRLNLRNGDQYFWNKVKTTIKNVRAKADDRRIFNDGRMIIVSNTGIRAYIDFLTEGNALRGKIQDKDGKTLHRLTGRWDRGISRILESGELEDVFMAQEPDEISLQQYGFNSFTVQLNELPKDHLQLLPPTDSRYRRDIRTLENGKNKKVNAKKVQKQRKNAKNAYMPMWFSEETDSFSKDKLWLQNGRYWISKQAGFTDAYSRQIIPLFSVDTDSV